MRAVIEKESWKKKWQTIDSGGLKRPLSFRKLKGQIF